MLVRLAARLFMKVAHAVVLTEQDVSSTWSSVTAEARSLKNVFEF